MKNESGHHTVTLAKSEFGLIERCRCSGYHVSLRNLMLHFNREEFLALVDLFKHAGSGKRRSLSFRKRGVSDDPK